MGFHIFLFIGLFPWNKLFWTVDLFSTIACLYTLCRTTTSSSSLLILKIVPAAGRTEWVVSCLYLLYLGLLTRHLQLQQVSIVLHIVSQILFVWGWPIRYKFFHSNIPNIANQTCVVFNRITVTDFTAGACQPPIIISLLLNTLQRWDCSFPLDHMSGHYIGAAELFGFVNVWL